MDKGTWRVKVGLAQMLKGGVIMDVVTAEHAKIAEDAGACAVMALEPVPADLRAAELLAQELVAFQYRCEPFVRCHDSTLSARTTTAGGSSAGCPMLTPAPATNQGRFRRGSPRGRRSPPRSGRWKARAS